MNIVIGILFILTGPVGIFVACRMLYRIIKLLIRGTKWTATIVDFYESYYHNPKCHWKRLERVTVYPIVRFKTEKGKVIRSRTLNAITDKSEKKWKCIRDSYLGRTINIFYIDEYPWLIKNAKDITEFNVLCMHRRWFKTFVGWIFILIMCALVIYLGICFITCY
jgi:hypothetical protein